MMVLTIQLLLLYKEIEQHKRQLGVRLLNLEEYQVGEICSNDSLDKD